MDTLPEVMLVFNPDEKVLAVFSIRIERGNVIDYIDLKAVSLPAAYREALGHGHTPTHMWKGKSITVIPNSVKP